MISIKVIIITIIIVIIKSCDSIKLGINKTCKNCKKFYAVNDNHAKACRLHKGRYIGAEASKHAGTRSGGNDKGLLLFWDCCDLCEPDAPGCHYYYHISYDDDDDDEKSVLINNYKLNR